MVDSQRACYERHSSAFPNIRLPSFKVASYLGWGAHMNDLSPWKALGRLLEDLRKSSSHQLPRDEGNILCSQDLESSTIPLLSPHSHRQHLGSVIHAEAGRNQIKLPDDGDFTIVCLCRLHQLQDRSEIYICEAQHLRQPFPARKNSGHFIQKYLP